MSNLELLAAIGGGSLCALFVAAVCWALEKREDRLDRKAWQATYGGSR